MPECRDLPVLFVYYRLPPSSFAEWPARVSAVHQRLRGCRPGLRARLMQRRDEVQADGGGTWMEVFEHPAGIDPELQKLVITALKELDPWRSGELHVECFSDVVDHIPA